MKFNEPIEKTIRSVLDVASYEGDKEKFIFTFVHNVWIEVVAELSQELTSEKKELFLKELEKELSNNANVGSILTAYFSEDHVREVVQEVASNAFSEYLKEVSPTLTEKQQITVEEILN